MNSKRNRSDIDAKSAFAPNEIEVTPSRAGSETEVESVANRSEIKTGWNWHGSGIAAASK